VADEVHEANIRNYRISRPRYLVRCYTEWKYTLYHNALCDVAKAIGSTVQPFRATSEPPHSWKGIFLPLEYYKKEIEEARRHKRAAWCLEKAFRSWDIQNVLEL
jgi:hypothetical protein